MIRGVKVDNKELQKFIDNSLAKEIRKLSNAGEKALYQVSSNTVAMFYKNANRLHWYSSIPRALKTKQHNFQQNSNFVWCDIEIYADEKQYYAETVPYYSIYNWADKYGYSHLNAARFVISTQWRHGFVGLPSPYPHYDTGKLKLYLVDEINRIWERKTKQLLK